MVALTDYVGPLPMWGWVAGGGLGLYLYEKHKGGAGSGTGGALSSLFGGSGQGTQTAAAQTASGTDAVQGDTNASWANDAIQYLESQGYTQSQAQSAIGTYAAGGSLDPAMATLVDNAVQGVGQPPQLILPTTNNPSLPGVGGVAGTTSAGAAGTNTKYVTQHGSEYASKGATPATGGPLDTGGHRSYFQYTVKKGDTLSKIGSMFGSGPHQIEAWNKLKPGSNPKVGSKIWV